MYLGPRAESSPWIDESADESSLIARSSCLSIVMKSPLNPRKQYFSLLSLQWHLRKEAQTPGMGTEREKGIG